MKLRTYKNWSSGFGVAVHVFYDDGLLEDRYDDSFIDVYLDANPRNAQVFVIPGAKLYQDSLFFVMHIDRMREYVHMARFDLEADHRAMYEDADKPVQATNDVFLEGYQAVDLIGPKGLDYSDMHIAKKLAYYLEETAP